MKIKLTARFFFISFMCLLSLSSFASSPTDYFRTVKSGNYNDITVWETSSNNVTWFPSTLEPTTSSRQVTIRNHTIRLIYNRTIDDLVISSLGQLDVTAGKILIIANGLAAVDCEVNGVITNLGTIATTGVLAFNSNGTYRHLYQTSPGALPIATWNDGSNCEILGFTTSNGGILNSNQDFYNLLWNCPNQTLNTGPSFIISNSFVRNSFSVLSTGLGSLVLSNIVANFNIKNYIQTSGNVILNNSNIPDNLTNINIAGDFLLSGGAFNKGPGSSVGNVIFNGSAAQNFEKTGGSISGAINFRANANSIVSFGTYTLNGSTGSFTAQSGSTLITANTGGFALTGATGSIQSTGTRTYPTDANYTYNGSFAQNTGTGLPATVNNLTISNNAGVTLRSGSLAVNGTLAINLGSLDLGTNLLTTSGPVGTTGSGTLFTQNTSVTPLQTNKTWAGTVAYNATGSQTIVSGTYTNLNGSGGARVLGTNINISELFTPGNPNLYTITGSTINFNGLGVQNIPSFNYNNLNGTGGDRILNGEIGVAGTFTPGTPGLYTTAGSTVNFNGAGAQSIPAFDFNNLTCSNSGTKTVNGVATVLNNVSVNNSAILNANGNLTLLATATKTANIAELAGAADIVGNVNIQSYIYGVPSGAIRGTKSMSSPINDATVSGAKTFQQLKNYIIITGPGGVSNGFDAGATNQPYAVTLNFYNEAASPTVTAFTPVPTLATSTTPGTGFLTFFRGSRDNIHAKPGKLYSPFAAAEDVLLTYTGPINKGDININIGFTNYGDAYDGFYLAGNPYPATIDWNAVRSASVNMGSSITIVTGGKANATYNAVGGISANGGSRYIQPGQGFYVQANSGGGILRFKENQKNIVETPARLLATPTNPGSGLKNKLTTMTAKMASGPSVLNNNFQSSGTGAQKIMRVTLAGNDFEEETVVVFDNAFSALANENDSKYFPGFDVSLATLSADNKPMAINLMPDVTDVSEIKLSINAKFSGNMSLNFGALNLGTADEVWLEDKYLNKLVQVRQGDTYNFAIDKNKVTTFGDNRMKLMVTPPTTLPVTYTKFEAKKVNQGVALQWSTANERSHKGFEIERASDANQSFEKIGFVAAEELNSPAKTYSFLDESPLAGNNYYRLKQLDEDGKFDYSGLKFINFAINNPESQIAIYPNPTTSYIKITALDNTAGSIQLNILNLNGVYVKQTEFNQGQELTQDVSTLPNGMYLVELVSNEGTLLSLNKFIKN